MPMMVTCHGCNTLYSLDERRISPSGGTFTCKECGSQWRIAPPASSEVSTGPSAPPAPSTGRDPIARAAESAPAGDASGPHRNPVSCPRCGHLFVPAGGSGREATRGKASPPGQQKPGILLVEDQEYFAELTREALAGEFEVTVVANISQARELLGDRRFEIVILDLSLEEGQDGAQILHATRAQGIPVLVFTARDEIEVLGSGWDALRAAGASDILIKGMHVGEELQVKVRSLVARGGR